MTTRQMNSGARRVLMTAGLAMLVIAPAGSQQELLTQQAAADLRTAQPTTPHGTLQSQRLANVAATGPALDGRGNPLWARPLNSLTATRQRPLFTPTRRPPPVAVASAPPAAMMPAVTRPPLALVGAIAGERDGIAIFLDETTKSMVRLKTGESHQGWTLQSVQGREATLQSDRQSVVLAIGSR